jgi:hypothetical protein
MTDRFPRQDDLLDCLREGRLTEADQLIGHGATWSEQDLAVEEEVCGVDMPLIWRPGRAKETLLRAAAHFQDASVVDGLIARNPALLPDRKQAFLLLDQVLTGLPDIRNLGFADWLVAHSEIRERLIQTASPTHPEHQVWDNLMISALSRNDSDAVQWMLHPPHGLPAWKENPQRPILTQAMQPGTLGFDFGPLAVPVIYLVHQGIRASVTQEIPNGRLVSPLQYLVELHERARTASALHRHNALSNVEWTFSALWPVLIEAGDNPDRQLVNGETLRDRIRSTQIESVALAWDRAHQAQASEAPAPAKRRPRLRS